MLNQKSKKILIYFFLFLIIGTFHNKNFNNINFLKVKEVSVKGLDNKNNFQLKNDISFLSLENILFLNEKKIKEIIETNNLVENYKVYKRYPSKLDITIHKTNFLAKLKKNNTDYILGSNRKLIETNKKETRLPFIFGDFNVEQFFELKKAIDETNFDYYQIKDLYFYKSGRWDIKTHEGLLIKLPKENLKDSIELFLIFLIENNDKKINRIDLRQQNQIISNG